MSVSWTIKRKLAIAFGATASLLAVASVVSLLDAYMARASQERAVRIAAATRAAAEAGTFMRAMDAGQKLIVVAGLTGVEERSAAGLKAVRDADAAVAALLDRVRANAASPTASAIADDMAGVVGQWKSRHAEILELIEQQNFDGALDVDLGPSFELQRRMVERSEALQEVLAAENAAIGASASRAFAVSLWVSLFIMVAALAVAGALSVVVRRTTSCLSAAASELRMGAQHVASASAQVAAASHDLSQGAAQQAASLEETSASMEEMASTTRQNADSSQRAATQVAETQQLVDGANAALSDLVRSMGAIRESSGKVTRIVRQIDEIAFQTSILALNAAVEAARAGDAGMGFAVVADEVRNLAQRSAQAAKDTAALIEESAADAVSGGAKVEAVVAAMSAITASSVRVRDLVDDVSVASRQQAAGIGHVTKAITQMERLTQGTAAAAEESATASLALNTQAERSVLIVRQLEEMVHGHHGATAAAPDPERCQSWAPARVLRMIAPPDGRTGTAADQIPSESTGTYGRA